MKKLLLSKIKIFFCLFLVNGILCAQTKAQTTFDVNLLTLNKDTYYKTISFGEKINFGEIENTATWSITKIDGGAVSYSLKGNEINNFVFDTPGIFEITFNENKLHDKESCSHPAFEPKMKVAVSPIKMQFDFSKIAFSENIVGGKSTDGIKVVIPIYSTTLNKEITTFKIPDLMVAGVGCNIVGKAIQNEVTIIDGIQNITYQLSGTAQRETYLMFDFTDINGQTQTYNLLEILK